MTDQTIEEMEAGLSDAHNMSANTAAKAEDMAKKLSIRSKELGRAQDRAEQAHNKLETVTEKLRKADIKVVNCHLVDDFIILISFRWQAYSSIWRIGLEWIQSTKSRL